MAAELASALGLGWTGRGSGGGRWVARRGGSTPATGGVDMGGGAARTRIPRRVTLWLGEGGVERQGQEIGGAAGGVAWRLEPRSLEWTKRSINYY